MHDIKNNSRRFKTLMSILIICLIVLVAAVTWVGYLIMNRADAEPVTQSEDRQSVDLAADSGTAEPTADAADDAEDEVTCDLSEDGTLTISGTGEIKRDPDLAGDSVTSIVIEDGVTRIGDCAFAGFFNLCSVTIPDSVTTIGENAFGGCFSLEQVTIPDSVASIEIFAFSHCECLQDITIPDGITSICDYTFCGCYSLTQITIPYSVTSIELSAFSDCSGLEVINYDGTETQWDQVTIETSMLILGGSGLECAQVQCTDALIGSDGLEYSTVQVEYPIANGDTVTIWCADSTPFRQDVTDDELPEIEEQTGVNCEFQSYTEDVAQEQYNLMMAAGNETDLLPVEEYYPSAVDGGSAEAARDDGVVVDLTDQLPDWAPDYWNLMLEQDDATKDNLTVDGQYYAVFMRLLQYRDTGTSFDDSDLAVSTDCTYPDVALKFLNWFFTDDGEDILLESMENEDYRLSGETPAWSELRLTGSVSPETLLLGERAGSGGGTDMEAHSTLESIPHVDNGRPCPVYPLAAEKEPALWGKKYGEFTRL